MNLERYQADAKQTWVLEHDVFQPSDALPQKQFRGTHTVCFLFKAQSVFAEGRHSDRGPGARWLPRDHAGVTLPA